VLVASSSRAAAELLVGQEGPLGVLDAPHVVDQALELGAVPADVQPRGHERPERDGDVDQHERPETSHHPRSGRSTTANATTAATTRMGSPTGPASGPKP
jgi:hypothetical protein